MLEKLRAFFDREQRLVQRDRELERLRGEIEQLRAQNESMRVGMRRCITCDYRLAAKGEMPGTP